jgi:hypothetical protein
MTTPDVSTIITKLTTAGRALDGAQAASLKLAVWAPRGLGSTEHISERDARVIRIRLANLLCQIQALTLSTTVLVVDERKLRDE